jgi:hypothetical protein
MQLSPMYHREESIKEGSRSRFIGDGWDGRGLSVGIWWGVLEVCSVLLGRCSQQPGQE